MLTPPLSSPVTSALREKLGKCEQPCQFLEVGGWRVEPGRLEAWVWLRKLLHAQKFFLTKELGEHQFMVLRNDTVPDGRRCPASTCMNAVSSSGVWAAVGFPCLLWSPQQTHCPQAWCWLLQPSHGA